MKKLFNRLISVSLVLMLAISTLGAGIVFAADEKVKNSYSFDEGDTLFEYVSGRNLKQNENILAKDGAILAKYWAPFCRVDISNLFDNMQFLQGSKFTIKCDVKLDILSPIANASVYAVVADENGDMIYNYKDTSGTGVNATKGSTQTITMEYKYSSVGNAPKYVCLLVANETDENNQVHILIDNVSVEQTELGSENSNEFAENYDAGYNFENENKVPAYVGSRLLKAGQKYFLDTTVGHSFDGLGKSIKVELWERYISIYFTNLFDAAGLVPGDKCKISAYVKVNEDSMMESGNIFMRVADDTVPTAKDGSQIMSDLSESVDINQNGWSYVELEYQIPTDRKPYAIEFASGSMPTKENSITVNIDDVSVTNLANLSAASEESNDDLELVNALGITPSVFENFSASSLVTRGDFARFMMTLYGGEEKGISEYPFTDVTAKDVYAKSIAFLKNANLMSGYPDGTFKPDNYITFGEAIKVIVSYLGYDFYAQNKGGYPLGYLITAKQAHLTDDMFKDEYSTITQKDLLKLYVNLLNTTVTDQVSFGDEIAFDNEETTILENVFDIIKAEGILNGTDATYLSSESNLSSKMISIGDEVFVCEDENVSGEIKTLLGYSVDYYYKETSGSGYNKLIYAQKSEGLNDTLVVYAKNAPEYIDGYVHYTDDTDREKKVKVSFNANIIYNGKCYQGTENVFDINDGNITFIDADIDGTYETVMINDVYYYVVNNVDEIREVIYTRFTDEEIIASDKQKDAIVNIHNAKGTKIDYKTIAYGNVLEVKKSKGDGVEIVDITVSTKTATGVVSEIGNLDSANGFVTVGRNSYGVTKTYLSLLNQGLCNEIVPGSNMTFYINSNSDVVAVENADNSKYAYIIEGYREKKAELEISAKVITAQDEIKTLYFADKVTLNGLRYEIDNSAFNSLFNGDELIRQLIAYETNFEGKIDAIKTVSTSNVPIDGELCKIASNAEETYRSGGYFGKGKYNLKSSTVIFKVPTKDNLGEEYFSAISSSHFSSDSKPVFDGYSVEGVYNNMDVMVVKDDNSARGSTYLTASSKVFLINKVAKSVSSKGDECVLLHGIIDGNEKTVKIIDERETKSPAFEEGDVILYSEGTNGEVTVLSNGTGGRDTNFVYVLDANGNNGNPKTITDFVSNTNQSFTHLYRPTMVKDGYVWGNEVSTISSYTDGTLIPEVSFPSSNMKVYVYDDKNKTFTTIGAGSINLVNPSTKEGAYMFVHVCSQKPEIIVIYQ